MIFFKVWFTPVMPTHANLFSLPKHQIWQPGKRPLASNTDAGVNQKVVGMVGWVKNKTFSQRPNVKVALF